MGRAIYGCSWQGAMVLHPVLEVQYTENTARLAGLKKYGFWVFISGWTGRGDCQKSGTY